MQHTCVCVGKSDAKRLAKVELLSRVKTKCLLAASHCRACSVRQVRIMSVLAFPPTWLYILSLSSFLQVSKRFCPGTFLGWGAFRQIVRVLSAKTSDTLEGSQATCKRCTGTHRALLLSCYCLSLPYAHVGIRQFLSFKTHVVRLSEARGRLRYPQERRIWCR